MDHDFRGCGLFCAQEADLRWKYPRRKVWRSVTTGLSISDAAGGEE